MRFLLFIVLLQWSLLTNGADLTLAKDVKIKSNYLGGKRNLYIKDVLDSYKIDCLTEGR